MSDYKNIVAALQRKYKIGFHKARIAVDLYNILFYDETNSTPFEKVETKLLEAAEFVIGQEYGKRIEWLAHCKNDMYKESRFGSKNNKGDK